MWTGPGESAPKKAKSVPSAGKAMAKIFWDSRGIILIDYLQKGKTIIGEYYVSLLVRFNTILKKSVPIWQKKVLFHHDNAPAQMSAIATTKIIF